eukprot:TRINITY_DN20897_c0_g1_i2.p1 TRINITY_DN20897_c0_g1~~TRINITY_DN20897_c0_g1_i2.p1  ORF type:complete len:171 (-),score=17.87 TRINITY_DN20897_c0_g1_i2:30-542(-)
MARAESLSQEQEATIERDIACVVALPKLAAVYCGTVVFLEVPMEICVLLRVLCAALVFCHLFGKPTRERYMLHLAILMVAITSAWRYASYIQPPGKVTVLTNMSIAIDAFIAVTSLKAVTGQRYYSTVHAAALGPRSAGDEESAPQRESTIEADGLEDSPSVDDRLANRT